MSKLSNAIFMMQLLSSGRRYSVSELAQLLEVTPRMVRSYREELEKAGVCIDTIKGPGGGYVLSRPVKMPEPVPTDGHLREIYDLLSQALQEKRKVRITYPSSDLLGPQRTIIPLGLIPMGKGWHCKAFCELRHEVRFFCLDCIRSLELLDINSAKEMCTVAEKAIVETVSLRRFARILVISDIHGEVSLLKSLLQKVGFCSNDALILLGDLTEKGPDSLGTVRYVMELMRGGNVWCIAGNCDTENLDRLEPDNLDDFSLYMELRRTKFQSRSILWEMSREAGLDALYRSDLCAFQKALCQNFAKEIRFLRSRPTILESEDYIFVHAGLESADLPSLTRKSCLRQTAWLSKEGPRFSKTVIVGHWLVLLYGHDRICANPRYNAKRNIFAIDGGCSVSEDGQLNCLIRNNDTGHWDFAYCDALPKATVLQPQKAQPGFCFLWGDNAVEPLDSADGFTRCRHRRTGYEAQIPDSFLYQVENGTYTGNFTAAALALQPGDTVSVLLSIGNAHYVKKDGFSGWYHGELAFLS